MGILSPGESQIISLSVFFKQNRWSSKSVTAFMTVSFIQWQISPVNATLDKIELITLLNFKFTV